MLKLHRTNEIAYVGCVQVASLDGENDLLEPRSGRSILEVEATVYTPSGSFL
jgi:hypothetical protein